MEETDYFEQCFREADMTAADIQNLRVLVFSKSFKRAVKVCLEGVNGKQQYLVGANLATPEGIAQAQKTQGEIQGMQFVIGELFTLAMKEPETEEKEKEDGRDE